jgi:hypothetical protein
VRHVTHRGRTDLHSVLVGNLKERDHLKDLSIDEVGKAWTRLTWLKIWTSG